MNSAIANPSLMPDIDQAVSVVKKKSLIARAAKKKAKPVKTPQLHGTRGETTRILQNQLQCQRLSVQLE